MSGGLVRGFRHPVLPLTVYSVADDQHALDNRSAVLVHDDDGVVGMSFGIEPLLNDSLLSLPPRTERHVVLDAVDGVPVYVTSVVDETVVWTHEGFEGAVVDVAREHLLGWRARAGTTTIFSGVFGFVPRVVDYEGFEGLVLIGEVEHPTGADGASPSIVATNSGWWGEIVVERVLPLNILRRMVADPENGENRKGFVVVYPRVGEPSIRFSAPFRRYTDAVGR